MPLELLQQCVSDVTHKQQCRHGAFTYLYERANGMSDQQMELFCLSATNVNHCPHVAYAVSYKVLAHDYGTFMIFRRKNF